jgi:hypothetical protein
MSRLETPSARRRRSLPPDLTLEEALRRIDDPSLANSLSIFFAELARAQLDNDREGIREANRAILEAMRGVPDGPIDAPLLPLLRKRPPKSRR